MDFIGFPESLLDLDHSCSFDLDDEYLENEKPTNDDISMSTSGTLKSDDSVSTDNGKQNAIGVEEGIKLGHNVESELVKEESSGNVFTNIDIVNINPSQYCQLKRKYEPSKQDIKNMINKATQRCFNCGHYVPYNIDLEKHMYECRMKKEPHKISTCDRCFIEKNSRKTFCEKYICKICEKTLSYREMLIDLKIHNNRPMNFVCKVCCRQFINGRILMVRKSYELSYYKEPEKQEIPVFTCDICDRNFSTQSFLTDHKKTHYDKKDFMCGFCCKIFDKLAKLKEHLETHPYEKSSEESRTGPHSPRFSDNIIAPWLQ